MPSPAASRSNLEKARKARRCVMHLRLPSPAHVGVVHLLAAREGVTISDWCSSVIERQIAAEIETLKKKENEQ